MEYRIDQSRRSGTDRRGPGKRDNADRRAVVADANSYINIIQKIPLFKGLDLGQFKSILRICSQQHYRPEENVIFDRAESREMYILIKGTLKVVLPDGRELSQVKPVEVVGEMGIFTGENRSASVVAAEPSSALAIRKKELLHLFHKDSGLGVVILTNVIKGLSAKVRKSNLLIDELKQAADAEEDFGAILNEWEDKDEEDL